MDDATFRALARRAAREVADGPPLGPHVRQRVQRSRAQALVVHVTNRHGEATFCGEAIHPSTHATADAPVDCPGCLGCIARHEAAGRDWRAF